MPEPGALERAAGLLGEAESIVAVGHIRPDGDALGAALAIALAARGAGKRAHVTFGEPFTMPDQFRYLDSSPYLPVDEIPTPLDLLVACDTATRDRLGTAGRLTGQAGKVLVVDHHVAGDGFGDVRYVVPDAAATAELAFYLIERVGWEITPDVAAALYTGLVTDTGRFQYSATSPAVHQIAAELLAYGVRPEVVGRHLYEEVPFGYLAVAAAVLERCSLDEERSFVWSTVLAEDLDAAGITMEDTDGLIDIVRLAREAEVACLLKVVDGSVKASLRSRGEVDVAAIATQFGGGGHHNASGFTVGGDPAEVIGRIAELL